MRDKVIEAIEYLKFFEPTKGYYLAFSGGKDSVVIYDLAVKAGVKFDAHYCVSPIDPLELQKFIKENYSQVQWDYYARGWWKTVVKKGLPTRRNRWCCEIIKEAGGLGRVVIVGNRKEEGRKRKLQKGFAKDFHKDKFFARPIIDWTKDEVWSYIGRNNLKTCSLYNEGFARLGCIMCPIATRKNKLKEMEQFPKVARLWRLSCDKIIERRLAKGVGKFTTGQELWDWWLSY